MSAEAGAGALGCPAPRAGFEALCRAMCEIAECPMPEMAVNERGACAISVGLDGVEVTILHDPAAAAEHAMVLTRFGRLPEGRELQAGQALLQMNCMMRGAASLCFGCDAATGDAVLQQVRRIDQTAPAQLFQSIAAFVRIALEWRSTYFLEQPPAVTAALASQLA